MPPLMALLFSQVAIPHASRHFFVAILTAPLDDAILQGDQGTSPERVKQQRASQRWRKSSESNKASLYKMNHFLEESSKGYLNPICQNRATTILQRLELWIQLAKNLASYFLAQPHLFQNRLDSCFKGKNAASPWKHWRHKKICWSQDSWCA